MKKIKSLLVGVLFLSATVLQTGCFGSFKLTNDLYDWNKGLDGGALSEVVFLAFVIVPVYGVTLFIDAVILNTIEYWGGSNPMAMQAGEVEVQTVEQDGNIYQITATQNKFHVEQMTGKKAGEFFNLVYEPTETTWYLEANGQRAKVAASKSNSNLISLFKPNGEVIEVDPAVSSRNAVKAAVSLEYEKITVE